MCAKTRTRSGNGYDDLTVTGKEKMQSIRGDYYYRDGSKNDDGSIGAVKISPREFLDALAAAYLAGIKGRDLKI